MRVRNGSAYYLDRPRSEILKAAAELIQEKMPLLANELLMDYDAGTMNEAGGLLYNATRTGPKITKSGNIAKGSDRVVFSRNTFDDLSLEDQIRVTADNIKGYDTLASTIGMSDEELLAALQAHNPNKLIYDDILDIAYSTVDSNKGLYSGPGQVGSPARNGGKAFNRVEAARNLAQFLTERSTDRLTGSPVSFPGQGHVVSAKQNPSLARDIKNMRAQQAEPNRRDGAYDRGLVNIDREENLMIGRGNEVDKLEELIDERLLMSDVSATETLNLLNLLRDSKGEQRMAASPEVRDVIKEISAARDAQTAGAVVGEKPLVVNAGEGSQVYLHTNGNGNGKHNGHAKVQQAFERG